MKILAFCIFSFVSIVCFGQTRLIAHRSHSGNNVNFRTAVQQNLFEIKNSNFGLIVRDIESIDTVILENKKIIVLRSRRRLINGHLDKTIKFKDTLLISNAQFFKAKAKDSLRAQILKLYKGSRINQTHFIGFDKKLK